MKAPTRFASYRDVPPGPYHIAPESFGRDFNQDRNVDLAPREQLYVKIVSLDSGGRERQTFSSHEKPRLGNRGFEG